MSLAPACVNWDGLILVLATGCSTPTVVATSGGVVAAHKWVDHLPLRVTFRSLCRIVYYQVAR